MSSDILRSTSLPVVLLTIEKPKAFRISITNLGLSEKFGLSVRLWNNGEGDSKTDVFMEDVKRFWSVESVQGGVENDPPCPTS